MAECFDPRMAPKCIEGPTQMGNREFVTPPIFKVMHFLPLGLSSIFCITVEKNQTFWTFRNCDFYQLNTIESQRISRHVQNIVKGVTEWLTVKPRLLRQEKGNNEDLETQLLRNRWIRGKSCFRNWRLEGCDQRRMFEFEILEFVNLEHLVYNRVR